MSRSAKWRAVIRKRRRSSASIPGVGEQKLKDFAGPFLDAIREYLQTNERRVFAESGSRQTRPTSHRQPRLTSLNESESETLRRFQAGESIDAIARARGFARSTIYSHLTAAIEAGAGLELDRFFTTDQQAEIAVAFTRTGPRNLVGLRDLLGGRYPIEGLRIFRALAQRLAASGGR